MEQYIRFASAADRCGQPCFGIKGFNPFYDIPFFNVYENIPVDPMHSISGVVKQLVGVLCGKRACEDNIRNYETELGRFPHFQNEKVYFVFIFYFR
jgi:hypothetical protein